MKHYRIQGQQKVQNEHQVKVNFHKELIKSLVSVIKLLPFIELAVSYGYAIENVWITMLMITYKTPDKVDSFVWIAPIILAILIRPYVIRFVHQLNFKIYREIAVVSFFMCMGAVGCLIIGLSCNLQAKSEFVRRIAQCSIGWTLMDMGFQFSLFFAQKIRNSYQSLLQKQDDTQKSEETTVLMEGNFGFYGLLMGYMVGLMIVLVVDGHTIKEFYRESQFAYYSVAVISMITGLRFYIQAKLNLPVCEQQKIKEEQASIHISSKLGYYLPGLQQLLSANIKTVSCLCIHFVIVFLNDIIVIYTTMWFSQPQGQDFGTAGQANTHGLKYGSIALICYTVIDNIRIKTSLFGSSKLLSLMLSILLILFLAGFYIYHQINFFSVAIGVALLNQFYRHTVLNHESQNNPVFERCIEITERCEKIFVLSLMPLVPLLILDRDDIPDCMFWSAGMAIIGLLAYAVSKKADHRPSDIQQETNKILKIQKIE